MKKTAKESSMPLDLHKSLSTFWKALATPRRLGLRLLPLFLGTVLLSGSNFLQAMEGELISIEPFEYNGTIFNFKDPVTGFYLSKPEHAAGPRKANFFLEKLSENQKDSWAFQAADQGGQLPGVTKFAFDANKIPGTNGSVGLAGYEKALDGKILDGKMRNGIALEIAIKNPTSEVVRTIPHEGTHLAICHRLDEFDLCAFPGNPGKTNANILAFEESAREGLKRLNINTNVNTILQLKNTPHVPLKLIYLNPLLQAQATLANLLGEVGIPKNQMPVVVYQFERDLMRGQPSTKLIERIIEMHPTLNSDNIAKAVNQARSTYRSEMQTYTGEVGLFEGSAVVEKYAPGQNRVCNELWQEAPNLNITSKLTFKEDSNIGSASRNAHTSPKPKIEMHPTPGVKSTPQSKSSHAHGGMGATALDIFGNVVADYHGKKQVGLNPQVSESVENGVAQTVVGMPLYGGMDLALGAVFGGPGVWAGAGASIVADWAPSLEQNFNEAWLKFDKPYYTGLSKEKKRDYSDKFFSENPLAHPVFGVFASVQNGLKVPGELAVESADVLVNGQRYYRAACDRIVDNGQFANLKTAEEVDRYFDIQRAKDPYLNTDICEAFLWSLPGKAAGNLIARVEKCVNEFDAQNPGYRQGIKVYGFAGLGGIPEVAQPSSLKDSFMQNVVEPSWKFVRDKIWDHPFTNFIGSVGKSTGFYYLEKDRIVSDSAAAIESFASDNATTIGSLASYDSYQSLPSAETVVSNSSTGGASQSTSKTWSDLLSDANKYWGVTISQPETSGKDDQAPQVTTSTTTSKKSSTQETPANSATESATASSVSPEAKSVSAQDQSQSRLYVAYAQQRGAGLVLEDKKEAPKVELGIGPLPGLPNSVGFTVTIPNVGGFGPISGGTDAKTLKIIWNNLCGKPEARGKITIHGREFDYKVEITGGGPIERTLGKRRRLTLTDTVTGNDYTVHWKPPYYLDEEKIALQKAGGEACAKVFKEINDNISKTQTKFLNCMAVKDIEGCIRHSNWLNGKYPESPVVAEIVAQFKSRIDYACTTELFNKELADGNLFNAISVLEELQKNPCAADQQAELAALHVKLTEYNAQRVKDSVEAGWRRNGITFISESDWSANKAAESSALSNSESQRVGGTQVDESISAQTVLVGLQERINNAIVAGDSFELTTACQEFKNNHPEAAQAISIDRIQESGITDMQLRQALSGEKPDVSSVITLTERLESLNPDKQELKDYCRAVRRTMCAQILNELQPAEPQSTDAPQEHKEKKPVDWKAIGKAAHTLAQDILCDLPGYDKDSDNHKKILQQHSDLSALAFKASLYDEYDRLSQEASDGQVDNTQERRACAVKLKDLAESDKEKDDWVDCISQLDAKGYTKFAQDITPAMDIFYATVGRYLQERGGMLGDAAAFGNRIHTNFPQVQALLAQGAHAWYIDDIGAWKYGLQSWGKEVIKDVTLLPSSTDECLATAHFASKLLLSLPLSKSDLRYLQPLMQGAQKVSTGCNIIKTITSDNPARLTELATLMATTGVDVARWLWLDARAPGTLSQNSHDYVAPEMGKLLTTGLVAAAVPNPASIVSFAIQTYNTTLNNIVGRAHDYEALGALVANARHFYSTNDKVNADKRAREICNMLHNLHCFEHGIHGLTQSSPHFDVAGWPLYPPAYHPNDKPQVQEAKTFLHEYAVSKEFDKKNWDEVLRLTQPAKNQAGGSGHGSNMGSLAHDRLLEYWRVPTVALQRCAALLNRGEIADLESLIKDVQSYNFLADTAMRQSYGVDASRKFKGKLAEYVAAVPQHLLSELGKLESALREIEAGPSVNKRQSEKLLRTKDVRKLKSEIQEKLKNLKSITSLWSDVKRIEKMLQLFYLSDDAVSKTVNPQTMRALACLCIYFKEHGGLNVKFGADHKRADQSCVGSRAYYHALAQKLSSRLKKLYERDKRFIQKEKQKIQEELGAISSCVNKSFLSRLLTLGAGVLSHKGVDEKRQELIERLNVLDQKYKDVENLEVQLQNAVINQSTQHKQQQ